MKKAKLPSSKEFDFISSLKTPSHRDVELGIGDDAAIFNANGSMVVAQDILVENVHFRLNWSPDLQWIKKAFCANCSDIDAMGAIPKFVLITIGIPSSINKEEVSAVINQELEHWGLNLIGGDTVSSEKAFIQLTLLADKPKHPLLRTGFKPGHDLYLSGVLGASLVGWRALEKELTGFDKEIRLHVEGRRQKDICQNLSEYQGVGCLDTSDSFSQSLEIIAEMSQVTIEVDKNSIPLVEISDDQKSRLGLNSDWFLEAAEDFEMIVSLPSGLSDIPLNWTKIGKISTGKPEVFISDNGKNQKVKPKGFNHFK
jgi:thiamine-monophosphate kinase